jgi:hypothetical protein
VGQKLNQNRINKLKKGEKEMKKRESQGGVIIKRASHKVLSIEAK